MEYAVQLQRKEDGEMILKKKEQRTSIILVAHISLLFEQRKHNRGLTR